MQKQLLPDNKIKILNVDVDNYTLEEALERIDYFVREKKNAYVVTPNLDHVVMLERDKQFQKVYQEADMVLVDGKPLVWLAAMNRTPVKAKISGSDLFPKLAELCADKGYTMFFLGAQEGVAQKAAERLSQKYEGLKVVGTYSPSYGFEKKSDELKLIIDNIKEAKPDVLIVGLGAPKQEKFIWKYRKKLQVPVSLGLGASLDFEAGEKKRAPVWMSEHGLEWLYRMIQEPKRLFKRYFIDGVMLIPLMIKYRKKG